MSYEYDIFISYRRCADWPQWVENHFIESLKSALAHELGDVSIFFDKNMERGTDWPLELAQCLAKSKVLVPLFSRQYFSSKWCCQEFSSMRFREDLCQIPNSNNTTRLIIPATIHDGEHLAPEVKRIQSISLNDFANPYMVEGSPKRERMFEEIRDWSIDLATAIEKVPDYSEKWLNPTIEQFVETYSTPTAQQTSIPRI